MLNCFQISRLKWANDDLRSKLFEANQHATRLAHEFGFKDIQHARDVAVIGSLNTNVPELNSRISILEAELRKHVQISKEALETNALMRRESQRTQHEFQQLHNELPELKAHQTPLSRQSEESHGTTLTLLLPGNLKGNNSDLAHTVLKKENMYVHVDYLMLCISDY